MKELFLLGAVFLAVGFFHIGTASAAKCPRVMVLATGGTIEAAAKIIEELGGEVVKMIFLIELTDLGGRQKLARYDVASAVQYEGE